jgi:hypothetical protein
MKKIIPKAFVTVFILAANTASAQQFDKQVFLKITSQERAAKLTELMKSKLSLNAAQASQVMPVNVRFAEGIERIVKSDDSRFSKARQAKNEVEQSQESFKKFLTPAQFSRFEKIADELMQQAKSRNLKKNY